MDTTEFDQLARTLARGGSRRQVLRTLGAGAATALLALLDSGRASAQCRGEGHACEGNQVCCSGLVCTSSGDGAARCVAAEAPPTPAPSDTEPPADQVEEAPQDQPVQLPAEEPTAPVVEEPTVPVSPARLRVMSYTCPDGFEGTDYPDFARGCAKARHLTNRVPFRLSGSARASRLTGDRGRKGEALFPDLPLGSVTLQTEPPGKPATVYAFCGADSRDPSLRNVSTGKQPATNKAEQPGITLNLTDGDDLTCSWFTVPDELSTSTGSVLIQARMCESDAPPDDDWARYCNRPADGATFILSAEDLAVDVATPVGNRPSLQVVLDRRGETDRDGLLRFGELPPGSYRLTQDDTTWCHASSDSVNAKGEVMVRADQRASLWIFNCDQG